LRVFKICEAHLIRRTNFNRVKWIGWIHCKTSQHKIAFSFRIYQSAPLVFSSCITARAATFHFSNLKCIPLFFSNQSTNLPTETTHMILLHPRDNLWTLMLMTCSNKTLHTWRFHDYLNLTPDMQHIDKKVFARLFQYSTFGWSL
jgi:hypothetical protein